MVSKDRNIVQDTVPGGPNNGQVEYVALSSANNVPGFVVPNTQFGGARASSIPVLHALK